MLAKNKFTVIHYYDEIQGRMQDVDSWGCGGLLDENLKIPEIPMKCWEIYSTPDGLCAPDGILT